MSKKKEIPTNQKRAPIALFVQTDDPRLNTYLQDVFHNEFVAVFGSSRVAHTRYHDAPDGTALRVDVHIRPVDMPDLLFNVQASLVDGGRRFRWQL